MIKIIQIALLTSIVSLIASAAFADDDNRLVNGYHITPAAGASQNVGSMPINMVATPDGKFALTSDVGRRESLWAIRTADGVGTSYLNFDNRDIKSNGLYYGIAAAPDGKVYAAQGSNDSIAVASLSPDGTLTSTGSIATTAGDFPTGLALDKRGYLYVTNSDSGHYDKPSSVAVYDTASQKEIGRYKFDTRGTSPNFPEAEAVLHDGSKLYVASERDNDVYVLSTANAASPTLSDVIKTGADPSAVLLNRSQGRLFVANAQSDSVTVIDTTKDSVQSTIALRPDKVESTFTATPTGLALSADESTLYVTLADMNAVAVVDLSHNGRLAGFIPVGWYPTAVVAAGGKLLVANARGTVALHPNPEFISHDRAHGVLNLIEGNVLTLDVPTAGQLAADTKLVMANDVVTPGKSVSPKSRHYLAKLGLPEGIEHVIYVVKENRTYDQVLGDLPNGNGDPKLTIFGNDITPNQHELAERYLLLDNFYDCGDVSGEGWPWSTEGIGNRYIEENVPYNYSGRGREYDFEGTTNGYPDGGFAPVDPDGNPLSGVFPKGAPPMRDIGEGPGGHLWDVAREAGVTVRNYGFFLTFPAPGIPDNYPAAAGLQPPGHDGDGVTDYDYRRFDLDYADSDAPKEAYEQTKNPDCLYPLASYGKHQSTSRIDEWRHEYLQMTAHDPFGDEVPALTLLRLGNDHTMGLKSGAHSPASLVADNDYAVGELVQTVSETYMWKNTVIFVVEDDAQDGADHVDCHRSTCYVISPFIQEHTHDGSFYNTDSVIHTIEALLKINPMTAYDAAAPVIKDLQKTAVNLDGYKVLPEDPKIIAARNPSRDSLRPGSPADKLARLADRFDFVHPDSAPAAAVNQMVWKSVRGMSSTMPAPVHSTALASSGR